MLVTALLWAAPAHALDHTVSLRARYGWVPNVLLNLGYTGNNEGASLPSPRPNVTSPMFGLEYALGLKEGPGGPALVAWVERMPLRFQDGYFDDRDSPPNYLDGDWVQRGRGFGLWNVGLNYMQEIPLTPTGGDFWMSLVFGGGLGVGFTSGELTVWHAGEHDELVDRGCGNDAPATDRYQVCQSDGTVDLPGVIPVVDLTLGLRFHVMEHAVFRLEGGIHDVLYVGIAGGGTF
ncbi:MAG: hypothetical protein KTR31_02560 [Myxococcales bacterium]|nr:hypothetical protein [Myxococcales bacterium]